jgi:hypothetical protein
MTGQDGLMQYSRTDSGLLFLSALFCIVIILGNKLVRLRVFSTKGGGYQLCNAPKQAQR